MHRKYIAQHSQDIISFILYVPVSASFATKISYIQHINDTKVLLKKKKRSQPIYTLLLRQVILVYCWPQYKKN